ncbi:MAG: DNA polymerase III subunit gamma/tau [Alistipes sp.]|nr:DNA polymerase III subunit gamma/tau [Alistipes sp.]
MISGTSLTELLATGGAAEEEDATGGETPDEPDAPTIDPESGKKLEHARARILKLMQERRPRFVPAFELMQIRGNTIALSVPTAELREEMLRNKTAMLMRIAELAGVRGMLELEIRVDEQIRAARPIKLEDRIKYITEKNPLVTELRKALDLDIE